MAIVAKGRRNIAENFNQLSKVHQRYRRTKDRRMDDDKEREHEFTFASCQTLEEILNTKLYVAQSELK